MKWSDFDGEYMTVVQEKTKTPLIIYCPDRLRDYLSALPRTGRHILAKNLTQNIGKRAAQKAVEEVLTELGIMSSKNRLVPHGWRYIAAVQLGDAGCSDADIQSVTGHQTLEMVQKYRSQATQNAFQRERSSVGNGTVPKHECAKQTAKPFRARRTR